MRIGLKFFSRHSWFPLDKSNWLSFDSKHFNASILNQDAEHVRHYPLNISILACWHQHYLIAPLFLHTASHNTDVSPELWTQTRVMFTQCISVIATYQHRYARHSQTHSHCGTGSDGYQAGSRTGHGHCMNSNPQHTHLCLQREREREIKWDSFTMNS